MNVYIYKDITWHPGEDTFLYYSFDNQNLNDDSGNNRNGTWYSGAGSYTTGVKSYGANNGNRGITIPSFIAGDFTLSIWVKPTNNGLAIQTLFGSIDWGSAYGRIHLHMYNSGQSNICLGLSKDGTYSASEAITWNEWNHIVLTKISGVFRLYKNKKLILTHTYNYNNQTGGTWTIGNGYSEDRHVTGVFDEVILETRGWTQEEIDNYYDNTTSKAYELKQAYIGEGEVFNWVLWDQTIIANSTTGSSGVIASTNGKIIRPDFMFGGGNGNYSKTTRTVNGQTINILQCNSSHGNVSVGISDANYTNLTSHKYIKLVCDYFNLGADQSNYSNAIGFGSGEGIYDSASSSTIGINEYFVGIPFAYNGGYSLEQIIKVSDMSVKTTITDLGNNNKYDTNTYTKTFNKETNTTYIINGGGPRFIKMYNDRGGGPVVCGDIHIYVSD